ncbi:metallophosphoesterase [Streptococcus cameli]
MAEASRKTILVMSDSHGNRSVVEDIKHHYLGKVDALFHNGDSELPADDPIWQGIHVVNGNCDYYGGYPDKLVTLVGDVRIAQTHGHLYRINYTWQILDYWAQEEEADICLYGHLHAAHAEKRGRTLFLNPGSVLQPRGPIQEKLYALITITDQAYQVRYYTLDHQLYEPLTEEFPR